MARSHGIFRDLPNLPESGQPSYLADPFPASDFPHGIFRDLPNLPESGQPSYLADPFPASDFPQDVFMKAGRTQAGWVDP
jgi:hypothetical protein